MGACEKYCLNNIIFQKPKLYETIENYRQTANYQKLESIYNRIDSNNLTVVFENDIIKLYCDNTEICHLTIMTPTLRYYYLQYKNTNKNTNKNKNKNKSVNKEKERRYIEYSNVQLH